MLNVVMMLLDSSDDSSDDDAKKFRRQFRVHIDRFFELVETTKSWMRDDKKPVFPRGSGRGDKKTIFVEIKVLMALRWLARGETFDTIGDLSETSETAAGVACETWVREFALREWGAWVKVPEGEDLRREMEVFARMGLVGCGFSMDAVHLWYDACPAELNSLHVGKEGYPTRAFNVALVKEKKVLNVSYELDTPDGGVVTEHGAYGIVDGGYHRWRPLQAVEKNASEPQAMHLSKWLESVRKDVECTFGIMKQRHRLLRSRLLLQDVGTIDDVFFSCAILHNMLLEDDDWAARASNEAFWTNPQPVDAELITTPVVFDDDSEDDARPTSSPTGPSRRVIGARSVAARARAALGARASPAARSAQHVRDPSKRRASSKSHNAVRDGCEIKSWQLASPKKAATRSQSRGSVGADALPPRGRSKASAAREPPERTGCHATFAEGSRPSSRRRSLQPHGAPARADSTRAGNAAAALSVFAARRLCA
ncbi:Plant transposon protein [Aureococcus anophagefferens]|nr:Plant transposon protein [Aureococcus anophagefferens]